MSPRKFDRYMVAIGMGTHPKLARLSDAEFRAHIVGVLAIAAMAPTRGCLLVGKLPAEAVDIAAAAGVPEKVAASALRKLEAVGVLIRDTDLGCLRVHDWDDINPSPGAERTRRWRDNGVTDQRHDSVTDSSPEVKKLEVEASPTEKNNNAELRSAVIECFAYWQERCNHPQAQLTADRRGKSETRLRERMRHHHGDLTKAVADVKLAIDGAATSPFIDEKGKRFDDIELICRSGSKLEDFMGRAGRGNVVPLRQNPDLPEHLRPTEEWSAQLAEHLASQDPA